MTSVSIRALSPLLLSVVVLLIGSATMALAALPTLPKNPILFEISTRPWLFDLSAKYGRSITKLSDIPMQEFQQLRSQGVDIVWLMGMWSLGPYGCLGRSTDPSLRTFFGTVLPDYDFPDVIGSPYAVTEYVTNPQLGTDADLAALKKNLNVAGLRLMLDFVPNHMAVDAPIVTSNPEYFIQATKGTPKPFDPTAYLPNGIANGKDPYGSPWTDTVQLNYWNSAARNFMLQNLLKVASLADAIRTDMSMLILNDVIAKTWGTQLSSWGYSRPSTEFWSDAISTTKGKYPGTVFMAEVYWGLENTLQSLGFDYTYDKAPYDSLVSGDTSGLHNWLSSTSTAYLLHGAHFVENHDEQPALVAFGTPQKSIAAALILHTLPGLKFNYFRQWPGFANRLEVHLRRASTEQPNTQVSQFYAKFLPIIADDVFKNGQFALLSATGSGAGPLFAWSWTSSDSSRKRLCIINYSGSSASGTVIVPNAVGQSGSDNLTITDLLSGQTFQRSASQMRTSGLFVVIDAWYAQIFTY